LVAGLFLAACGGGGGGGVTVKGTVTEGGSPVSGASVSLLHSTQKGGVVAKTTTNKEGRYRFDGIDRGKVGFLYVRGHGCSRLSPALMSENVDSTTVDVDC
jgi:Carboxypeptidase regulatory-like domain